MHSHESHEHEHGSHHESHVAELPRDTEGLPDARKTEFVELADGDEFEFEIAPVKKRIGDATVRMLAYSGSVPGPTREGPAGRDDHRPRDQPRRPRRNRPLARPSPRESLRRNTRHAGADPGRRALHLPGACAGPRRLLVPPAHPRGLRPRDGAVRKHPRYAERCRLLAAREPGAAAHARRHLDRGGADRRLQGVGDDARGDGPVRQRDARRGRARPVARGQARRGRALLLHQHRQHTRVQRCAAGRTDETGRRRRRTLRARRARRRSAVSTVRACRRRRAVSGHRSARARAPNARAHLPACVDHRRRRQTGAVARRGVRSPAY